MSPDWLGPTCERKIRPTLRKGRPTLRKYVAFMNIAMGDVLSSKSALCAETVFLLVLTGIFSALWGTLERSGVALPGSRRALVWYLATTEWILMSVPRIPLEMGDEIRRGDVVPFLVRPASYLTAWFARAMGALAVRVPAFGVAALAGGLAFGQGLPDDPKVFLYTVPFGIAATAVVASYDVWIGLGAFWLGNIRPVLWIWQKLLFILGGLMLPLDFCPAPLQRVAAYTPFASLLYGPASFLLHPGDARQRALPLAVRLVVWLGLAVAAAAWAFRSACRRLEVHGG